MEGGSGRFSYGGIELLWLVLGFIGAALGIGHMPPMSKPALASALAAGVVCAAIVPTGLQGALALYLGKPDFALPSGVNNVLAFVFGIGGMFIVPGLINLWQAFVANPAGFIARARRAVKGEEADK